MKSDECPLEMNPLNSIHKCISLKFSEDKRHKGSMKLGMQTLIANSLIRWLSHSYSVHIARGKTNHYDYAFVDLHTWRHLS